MLREVNLGPQNTLSALRIRANFVCQFHWQWSQVFGILSYSTWFLENAGEQAQCPSDLKYPIVDSMVFQNKDNEKLAADDSDGG